MKKDLVLRSQADVTDYLQEDIVPALVFLFQKHLYHTLFLSEHKILNAWTNFGGVVTATDLKMSDFLLNWSTEYGFGGLRKDFPASRSEEEPQDKINFANARMFWMVDPMDGSGDANKKIMPPTVLLTLFERIDSSRFGPKATITIDPMSGLVVVCDGQNVDVLDYTYSPNNTVSDPQKISTSYRAPSFNEYGIINLPHRLAYEQNNYATFRDRLRGENMLNIHDIPAGGAGNQFLSYLRGCLDFTVTEADKGLWRAWFHALTPLTVWFNPQPDWKHRDTAGARHFMRVSGQPDLTTIYGNPLPLVRGTDTKEDMFHTTGTMTFPTNQAWILFATLAEKFEESTNLKLTDINY